MSDKRISLRKHERLMALQWSECRNELRDYARRIIVGAVKDDNNPKGALYWYTKLFGDLQ